MTVPETCTPGRFDTPSEERFDRITRLAQELFDVPVSLISMIDGDRLWFKSRQGMEASETARSNSLCDQALKAGDLFVIEDTVADERFVDNASVQGMGVRFYAGCPIKNGDGRTVGTFCIVDYKPRRFDGEARNSLRDLVAMVERELLYRPPVGRSPGPFSWRYPWRAGFGRLARVVSRRRWAAVLALLGALLAAVLAEGWDRAYLTDYQAEIEHSAYQQLGMKRGALESAINAKLHLVQGLSGFVQAGPPEIDDQAFNRFVPELMRDTRNIESMVLAPAGVVRHIWPREGHEGALGLDLLGDPSRRASAARAIATRSLWLAGPYELAQGGTGVVGRLPLFVPDPERPGIDRFWGFGIVVIDWPGLLAEVGLETEDSQFRYALRGRHAMGAEGAVFFGDRAIFEHAPLIDEIVLPAGAWELAILPIDGWPSAWPGEGLFRLFGLALAALLGWLFYVLLRLPDSMRRGIQEATAALARSETRFRDAIEALPTGFAIYDAHDRLAACNERFREMYARSRPRLQTGRHFEEILRYGLEHGEFDHSLNDEVDDRDTQFEQMLARHRSPVAAYDQKLGDGRWIRVVERRMREGGSVSFHRDVTGEKSNERALIQARRRAEEANHAKSTFLATVSHEVRTPLNGVLGLLGLLESDRDLSPRQAEYVATAHSSAQQLLILLNEILDISKMEAGKLELEPTNVRLDETIDAVLRLIEPQATAKGLFLHSWIAPELITPVRADEGRLRQILLNLLTNAVKFTDQGEVRFDAIVRRVTQTSVDMELIVADTGIGFEPDDADRLFQPFAQLDDDADRRFAGTGLGLAICRRLVDLMEGDITGEGRPGAGARFVVKLTLPRAAVAPLALGLEQAPTPAELGWTAPRVLIAEDSPTNQLVFKAMLEDTGYQVDMVGTGREALEALSQFEYDIVLMDVYMPVLDGVAATREIRANTNYDDMPVVALTANAMEGDRERFMQAGMDDYLPKPVGRPVLLATLYRWCRSRREGGLELD